MMIEKNTCVFLNAIFIMKNTLVVFMIKNDLKNTHSPAVPNRHKMGLRKVAEP